VYILEFFAQVPNTNGRYWASTNGYIYDKKLQHNVPSRKTKRGWLDCKIWFGEIRKTINIHRVIAMTFYGESTSTVNHIDGNKLNNNINNLEYATLQEQNLHRSRIINVGNQTPIYCHETGDIYPSCKIAGEILNIDPSHISQVAAGEYGYRSVHGYHFTKI
jgi:hypothetical protein